MNSHLRPDGNLRNEIEIQTKRQIGISVQEIVLYALLASLLLVVQVALAFLPNIELVSLLLIVYTRVLGKKAFIPLYVFVLAEGLIYGFGIWWINYLYLWAILVFLVLVFRKIESVWFWTILSCIYGLCFGTLSSVPYFFIGGVHMAITYILNGIPFDLLHGAGNFVTALVLAKPLYIAFQKMWSKCIK